MLDNAIRQTLRCKYVSLVYVVTDDQLIIDAVNNRYGHDTREPYAREPSGLTRVEVVKESRRVGDEIGALPATLDGLRKVRLEASYCLLIQATFPFLDATDLDRLVEAWWASRHEVPGLYLSKPGEPTQPAGAAWIVDPFRGYADRSPVAVTTPCFDINVRTEYRQACAEYKRQREQGGGDE